jgi:exodeoxyribonuclease VII small subunit
MTDPIPAEIAALSFEDALRELEEIVRKLEGGKSRLDEAISDYERGTLLKRHCEDKLRRAQERIDKIVVSPDGTVTAETTRVD